MLVPLLLFAQTLHSAPPTVYHGRNSDLRASVPRIESDLTMDGVLDEPAWRQASLLTGFSQFSPLDALPAQDSTEVLVWYSPSAIHFGVRAYEAHGPVRATLADRDKIFADDHVQLLIGTFNDGRQATVFAVNPLGVQGDGTLVETGAQRGTGFNNATFARESADLNPDFVFQSKGRVTPYGYEVEIRIPFKSLRFQSQDEQRWGINVLRRVQHSGHEDSWTPARRAASSFLAQSGTLEGLRDLRRGLVLDLNPVLTARAEGTPKADGWDYQEGDPQLGGNVRWGMTSNLTLNGTVNPDFSQVEADAGQLSFDPRSALFFPEKRPFFLEGTEQFAVPSQLIYTRRIVEPIAAAKLVGKVSGTNVAFLSAVDDRTVSFTGDDNPVFNILRVQRDIGGQSRVGMAYTDRIDGSSHNRVLNVDSRLLFGGIYTLQMQLAGSRTRQGGVTTSAPLWDIQLNRNGRRFGARYQLRGIDEDFRAGSGFISRPGIARGLANHRVTLFGQRGALIETFTTDVSLDGTWKYDRFVGAHNPQDRKLHFNFNASLRGGWQVGTSLLIETFGFDDDLYADYAIELPRAGGGADTVAFTGTPHLPNLDYVFSLTTPAFSKFSGSIFVVWGKDENFFEWSSADILIATLGADWRPTSKVRLNASYLHQQYDRRTDGTTVGIRRVPRLKLEYQLSRPVFFRIVGEYDADRTDALRDDSRTNAPILIFDPGVGDYVRALATRTNRLRADVLFSYQPNPGTVFFAGYGSIMQEDRAFRLRGLRRDSDAFFIKASYLFRMN
jgi:hypothetical protein